MVVASESCRPISIRRRGVDNPPLGRPGLGCCSTGRHERRTATSSRRSHRSPITCIVRCATIESGGVVLGQWTGKVNRIDAPARKATSPRVTIANLILRFSNFVLIPAKNSTVVRT